MSKAIVQTPQSRAHVLWDALLADAAVQSLDLDLIRVEGSDEALLLRVRASGRTHTFTRGPAWRAQALEDLVHGLKGELLTSCMAARTGSS